MEQTNKEIMDNTGAVMVTAGTDIKKKFAFCVRYMNGRKYLFIHERGNNGSYFSDRDLITAIAVDKINEAADLLFD